MAEKNVDDVKLKSLVHYSDLADEPLQTLAPIQVYEHMPIVTLEEAIEPLLSIVPDIKQMVCTIKERCRVLQDDLTINEAASIMLYTMKWEANENSLNLILNELLRKDNRDELKVWFLYLKLLFKSLSKLPSINCVVYQGIKMNLINQYPQGKTFTWWGFSLCTQSAEILENEEYLGKNGQRTRFKIECKSAKDIQNYSFHKTTHHILLPTAIHYKVISSLDSGNGLNIIQIKEIDPFPLLQPMNADGIQSKSMLNTSFSSVVSKLTGISPTYQNTKLEEVIRLCKSNSWINLTALDLIDRDMPIIIQQALIDQNCKGLYLAGNNLTCQGISILTDALYNNRTLMELDLADNSLSDQSIKILMNILLTNTTILEKLHLGYNCITDEGIEYIVECLKTNHSLTHLMLNHNRISNRGVHLLSSVLALHNTSLEILSLSSNMLITDTSIDSLIIMLKHNEILKTLDIKHCSISQTSCTHLQQLTNQRKDFKLFFNTVESSCILS